MQALQLAACRPGVDRRLLGPLQPLQHRRLRHGFAPGCRLDDLSAAAEQHAQDPPARHQGEQREAGDDSDHQPGRRPFQPLQHAQHGVGEDEPEQQEQHQQQREQQGDHQAHGLNASQGPPRCLPPAPGRRQPASQSRGLR